MKFYESEYEEALMELLRRALKQLGYGREE